MSKNVARKQSYGGRRPKDYLPAHNHIMHTAWFTHGTNGLRWFWIPPEWVEGGEWSKCPCGWGGPKWETHYALTEHAQHWKKIIKKLGSLNAAYREVEKRLRKIGARSAPAGRV
jgi:hypothetical protein